MTDKLIHPDTACEMLGLVPRPGEGKWARYDRRRTLHRLGLRRFTGPFKGYRYSLGEVLEIRKRTVQLAA